MTFAAPLVLASLAVLVPVILVLHTLRREEHATASLFLWEKVASRRRGASERRRIPWSNPHLWLHLAIAILGVVALAGPRFDVTARTDHLVFVLDASRSMQTADVEPTRFRAATDWIIAERRASDPGALASLILVGDRPRVVAARRGSGTDLAELLANEAPTDATPAWPEAIELVTSLLAPGERHRIVLLSDGTTDEAIDASLRSPYNGAGLEVERHAWGGPVVNVGVTDVLVEPRGNVPTRWTVKGEVRSQGLQAGDVVRVQVLYRPPGNETSLPWTGGDVAVDRAGSGSFELPIELPGDGLLEIRTAGRDQQPADDVARRIVRQEAATTRIAMVGPEAPSVLAALRAIGGLEVARFEDVPPVEVTRAFDLVIATRAIDRPVDTSVFWYGTPPEEFVVPAGDVVPTGPAAASGHPLMRDVDASELGVVSARSLHLPDGAEPLIRAGDVVLAWSRTTDLGRQVAFGFGPDESAWASQVSFPAFIASLVRWSRSTDPTAVATCLAGRPCPLPREAFGAGWQIVDDEGAITAAAPPLQPVADPHAGSVWLPGTFDRGFAPQRAGLYELRVPDRVVRWIAVDAPPGPVVDPPAAASDEAGRMSLPEPSGPRALPWRWIALLTTGLLVVDAVFAFRSARTSLSARSRGGRAEAIGAVALLTTSILFGAAAASLVPTLHAQASATRVVLRPASEPGPSGPVAPDTRWSDRGAVSWRGWRAVDVAIGAPRRVSPEPDTTDGASGRPDAVAANLERGIVLALGLHAGRGDLVVDARRLRTPDVPASTAVGLSAWRDEGDDSVVLWTEGVTTGADAQPDAPGFRSVTVPRVPRSGGAFDLVAVLAGVDRPSVLEVFDEAGARIDEHRVAPGTTQVRRSLASGEAGWSQYLLRLRTDAAEGDEGAAVIDEVRVAVNVADPLRVLVVASAEETGRLLVSGLEAQRITVDRVAGSRLPATLERLLAFDAVMLVDVPASEIHPFHQAMLQAFVREEGRGLVIVGGPRSFGPGGYYSTLLDDVSPLSSRIEEEVPEIAMTFVLDRSGSMNAPEGDSTRLDLAKLATFEAIRLLGERSQAALIAFDSVATTLLPLQSSASLDPFRTALQAIVAGGGTSLYPALVEAYGVVAASGAATRHIIVLTDGLSEEGDFEEVLGRIGDLGVDTSFVGIGNAASRRQLTRLARYGGGSLHFTSDARALPGILAQEALMLSADPIEERTTDPTWVAGELPEFLGEVDEAAIAPLLGYVRTTAKDEATVLLQDAETEDPLLATWRYGLGRVAAFPSEADGPWSGTWTQRDDFATFWSQLARWSATTVPSGSYRIDVSVHEANVDVALDVAPDQDMRTAPVAQLARGDDGGVIAQTVLTEDGAGRWTGRIGLPSPDGAIYVVRVRTAEDGMLTEPIDYAFVHGAETWDDQSVIGGVPLDVLARHLRGVASTSASPSVDDMGAPFAPPDLSWRGTPRGWLVGAVTAFMIALALRFGGFALRSNRSRRG